MKTLFVTVTHDVPIYTKSTIQLWDADLALPIDDELQHPSTDHAQVPFGQLDETLRALAHKHQARLVSIQDTGAYVLAQPQLSPACPA